MRRMRLVAVLLVALLLLAMQIPVTAQSDRAGGAVRLLVGLRPGVHPGSLAGPDVEVLFQWPDISAMAVKASPAGQARLTAHGGVAYVEPDVLRYPSAASEITWGLDRVNAPEAWATTTGTNTSVCIIDSGIDYDHPEFYRDGVSIVKDSKNFNGDNHATAADGLGHGTHVAGTVAAALDDAGVAGVAYGVDLYIARIFDDEGGGAYTSVIINAVDWCETRAQVFNMSFGGSFKSRTEEAAYKDAYNNKGRLLIAASGNDGGRISYPAKYASVVAVGALNQDNTLASFSNSGSEQELSAPGVQILSSVPLGTGLVGSAAEDGTAYDANPLEFAGTGDVSGQLYACGLADTNNPCAGSPSGTWVAMISRGGNSFADKVTRVMSQGASAAIIANNDTANPDDAGSFTLGATGTWIPVVSVSNNSGVAIRSGGLGTGNVHIGATDYAFYQGTSMASPHAVGVAALTWAANPSLSNASVRQILQNTAQDLGAAGRDNTFGYGLVQADAAVAAAVAAGGGGGGGGGGNAGMNVAVTTDKESYSTRSFAYITVTATDASTSAAISGAAVALEIKDAGGSTVATGSGTTNASGQWIFKWRTPRTAGTYTAVATVTRSGYTDGTGSKIFDVN